jgi:CheY-like chemotaxis protein
MTRILAIEPNPEREALLRRLVRDAVRADITLVNSTKAALTAIDVRRPDLILASTLIAPNDERELVTYLRDTATLRHVPILTIPPVVSDVREPEPTGLLARLRRRRPAPPAPMYDFGAIATRIEESIAQSGVAIAAAAEADAAPIIVPPAPQTTAGEPLSICRDMESLRERAMRWEHAQLSWLSGVNAPWGITLRLINLSSTGLLVETGARLVPGTMTTFRLWGPERDVTVPARIVRSDVASVDSIAVKYHAAAVFEYAFDTLMPVSAAPVDAESQLAQLVDIVCEKSASGVGAADLRAEFEAGVMKLVTARDIRLRDVPVVENDGRESVYFTIAGTSSPAVLQVTFDANYQPSAEEFDALKAAAAAAARIVPVTATARQVALIMRPAQPRLIAPLRLVLPAPESSLELRPTA